MTLREPNTAMAVTIDIGEANDIHPRNKQDVGKRLALAALSQVYGQKGAYSGPVYESMEVDGSRVRLKFRHADGGLKTSDERAPVGFAIAGPDNKFVWARAEIEGETVVVQSSDVTEPRAVRYGWADNPDVNLSNGAGLPASPFRTDDWPGTTVNNR
jgi:sialate O-acetylesterase